MQVLLAAFVWGGAVGLGELEAVAASFRRDGFALIEDFASLVERSATGTASEDRIDSGFRIEFWEVDECRSDYD